MKVGVNPPKTPVTKGSSGMAAATVPNVCKMPGPPAPFVPTPLPNIGQSSDGLAKATKKVKFEKKAVAIKGSTFNSKGDIASKGTGGGLVSATTHGTTKFVAPGSMNVKAEGKNVQLLGDQMTNNNSNPANALTIAELQGATTLMEIEDALAKIAEECNDDVNQNEGYTKSNPPSGPECTALGTKKHKCCEDAINQANNPKVKSEVPYTSSGRTIGQASANAAKARADTVYNAAKATAQGQAAATGLAGGAARSFVTAATKGVWASTYFGGAGAPHLKADVVIVNSPSKGTAKSNINKVLDFKFNCGDKGKMSKEQRDKYKDTLDVTMTQNNIIHSSW